MSFLNPSPLILKSLGRHVTDIEILLRSGKETQKKNTRLTVFVNRLKCHNIVVTIVQTELEHINKDRIFKDSVEALRPLTLGRREREVHVSMSTYSTIDTQPIPPPPHKKPLISQQ